MADRRMERFVLIGLELLMGIVAVICGIILAAGHAESALKMDKDVLDGTPFGSFLIPGLVLAIVVGGSLLVSCGLWFRRADSAAAGSLIAGMILVGWISGQVIFIGLEGPIWQQPLYFGYGLAIVLLAIHLGARGWLLHHRRPHLHRHSPA